MRKILFIEDDVLTHKLVHHSLDSEFEVLSCYSLKEANQVLDQGHDFSLVIVDRGLPDGDGISICLRLRQNQVTESIPVIFLSGATAETDKVGGFFAGADDYITKPFGLMELKARVQARLRKVSNKFQVANLELDLDSHRAHFHSAGERRDEIVLTRTEFKILATLIQSIDQVFSRERLLSKVWGENVAVSDRVVDSHMSHLRKKISHSGVVLESLRGEGYRITTTAASGQVAGKSHAA